MVAGAAWAGRRERGGFPAPCLWWGSGRLGPGGRSRAVDGCPERWVTSPGGIGVLAPAFERFSSAAQLAGEECQPELSGTVEFAQETVED